MLRLPPSAWLRLGASDPSAPAQTPGHTNKHETHRLEQVGTDVLLTLNLPPSAQDPPAPLDQGAAAPPNLGPEAFCKVRS